MIIEIFVPTYWGSVLIEKSRKLTHDIYCSNWFETGLEFRKNFLILGVRTLKPIALYGGGLFLLNLSIFLSVGYLLEN